MTSTATITAADTLLLATRLAGSDAGPLDRGAPSLLGGTKYFVGLATSRPTNAATRFSRRRGRSAASRMTGRSASPSPPPTRTA